MTKEQIRWLSSYDRETGALSTTAGYGDALKAGFVINRGPDQMPDLFITAAGRAFLAERSHDGR
jgi:hypothetical protein